MLPTIGWTKFALDRHMLPGQGLSYFSWNYSSIPAMVQANWANRKPGHGETGLDRKVVVPLVDPSGFYCPPRIPLMPELTLQVEVKKRQAHEDPYIEVACEIGIAHLWGFKPTLAKSVEIVCYAADVLLENGGTKDTDCDWEIVAVLCHDDQKEGMEPLTMARNFLQKPGGTFTPYTAEQFAEAIYDHSCKRTVKVVGVWKGEPPNPYFC